jgi:internalin A
LDKKRFYIFIFLIFILFLSSCNPGTENQVPIITSEPLTWATVNQPYLYDVDATDPDGDTFSFSLLSNLSGMTINASTGLIQWIPTAMGNFEVIVEVTDNGFPPKSITQNFAIQVNDISHENHAPSIITNPHTSITLHQAYDYDVDAADPDGDTLTYSLITKPLGMSIDSSTGLIFWNPTETGDYDVTVEVSDGELSDTQSFTVTVDSQEDYIIQFEDYNLEQVIRGVIYKPQGPIYLSDVKWIKELYAPTNKGIKSLEGIQQIPNLEAINISKNQIINLSPLQSLTKLKWLQFDSNQVSDISILQHLTNLEYLVFYDNQVSDITPLQNMKNLVVLDFWDNQVSDISALQDLTNLEELSIHENQITDISALQNMHHLLFLNFSDNQVTDISALENLTNLSILYFGNSGHGDNQVSDITPLQNLTNLVTVGFSDNQVTDISALENLTNLVVLRMNDNQISNISPLKNLTNLKELWFSTNQVSDISALQNLTNLEELNLGMNHLSNVSVLQNLTNLVTLNLVYTDISNISFLQNLTHLRALAFDNNQVSDITPLQNLINLEDLYFSINRVSDISALVNNKGLGKGDYIEMKWNSLELTAGSKDMQDIETLIDRGVNVVYEPQGIP